MPTVLITGTTSGLGMYLARELARRDYLVLAHGRDPDKTARLVKEITADGGTAEAWVADLADLREVRDLGERVTAAHEHLDVLINNAGVGGGPPRARRETSRDGYELRWAVNYLAPVLLTRMLLPALRAAAPSRIVNVGSVGQSEPDFDDLDFTRRYDGGTAYSRSKFAIAAHTFALARELSADGVSATVLHPATYMDTTMVREGGVTPWTTVETGGRAVLALVTTPVGLERSGSYFDGTRESSAHRSAYREDVWRRLDEATSRMLRAKVPDL